MYRAYVMSILVHIRSLTKAFCGSRDHAAPHQTNDLVSARTTKTAVETIMKLHVSGLLLDNKNGDCSTCSSLSEMKGCGT